MLTLLLLTACGSSEHQIIDSSSPALTGDDESCEPTVVEQPIINLSCPEPVINLSCPEPVIQVEVAAPDVQVAVAAPEVDVEVAAPDMTGIEAAIDDMVIAFEDLSLNSGQTAQTRDYHAQTGNLAYGWLVVFTNSDSRDFIITSVIGNDITCDVKDSTTTLISNFCSNLACSRTKSFTSAGVHASIGVRNGFTIPVASGQFVECYSSGSNQYLLQGYYQ